MLTTEIVYFGRKCTLACDARCDKAWGINHRPKIKLDPRNPDDIAYLADDELGRAPDHPGTWEGGHAKPDPSAPRHNKWCARECERSEIFDPGKPVVLTDFSRRHYNIPAHDPAKA